ncbi:helix-turn-helix domain-containing protein [Polynucleobacter sp. UK-Kesae-W10]|uniref:winged helix-turn-helix domain-containing protein n=1 Tax=Polynucleobacter sp. UK-Kesae-W10 TaxID=1819738 RepID=UPI001C0BC7BD|nr:helix-turn-helix domain-containing protein [Polynucleobacter sp. UK-Kesae-W10]MBU3577665.1 helix-turn-helix transcriptional regulator [Polynucleobacter sp. UK-Kesae-W10]
MMTALNYLSIFEALSHETRLRVFDFIYQSGEAGARPKEMIDQFRVDSGTLDFHLKKLVAAGLIILKAGSKRGVYCLSENIPDGLTQLFDSANADRLSLIRNSTPSELTKREFLH